MNVIELLDKEPFNLLPEEMPFEQKVIITLLTKEDEDEDKNTSSLIANYFHHSVDEMFDIARKGLLDYKNNAITQFATKIDNKQKTIMSNVSSSKKS